MRVSSSESQGRTSLADYRLALSTPGALRPVIASLFARLPIAMIGMSALLYVRQQMGAFDIAGLVSAGVLIGVSVGSVAQGRLIDRFGPTRPLLLVTGLFTMQVAALIVAIELAAPTPVLVVLGAGMGATEPMTASASRALWTRLLPPGAQRNAGYSYEAISMEVFFILGPGLAGALITMPWPGTGLVLGALCMAFGAILFALSPVVREWGPRKSSGQPLLGALTSPGMRTLALAALGFGIVIGFVEVGVPAAAANAGRMAIGGLLLSLWSISSVAFGVAYSLRPWPRTMRLRLPVLLILFGALVALLAIPTTLWGLALAMLGAGILITPQATAHSSAVEIVAPQDSAAEAFGWVLTAITLGLAFGQSVGGHLVESSGPPLAFLAAAACAVAIGSVVWLVRNTVRTPAPTSDTDTPVAV